MNIQFYHGLKHKGHDKEFTMAMVMPSKTFLENALARKLQGQDQLQLSFGISYVNKDHGDQYVRRTGRIVSTEKIQIQDMILTTIAIEKDVISYTLENKKLILFLETRQDRDKVYLVAANTLD